MQHTEIAELGISGVSERHRIMTCARRTIKRVNRGMLFRSKYETEQIEILLLPIRMHRLGDDDCSIFVYASAESPVPG